MSSINQPKFYTPEEIGDILRVSVGKVYQLIESGELKATKVGRQFRISAEALQEYINRQTQ